MTTLSDDVLVAYADDELPPAQRATVERRLAHDAGARDRLATFTSTGQWLARAYDDSLRASPPDALVRAIRDAAPPLAQTPKTSSGWSRGAFWQHFRVPGWGLLGPGFGGLGIGLATGVAVMLALPGDEPAGLAGTQLIAQTLETAASGEPRLLERAGERLEITAIGTMRTAEGAYCREFTEIHEMAPAPAVVTHGLACREAAPATAEPHWQTVARITVTPARTEAAGFALASGQTEALFDNLLAAQGPLEVLPPDEERERLQSGWQ